MFTEVPTLGVEIVIYLVKIVINTEYGEGSVMNRRGVRVMCRYVFPLVTKLNKVVSN